MSGRLGLSLGRNEKRDDPSPTGEKAMNFLFELCTRTLSSSLIPSIRTLLLYSLTFSPNVLQDPLSSPSNGLVRFHLLTILLPRHNSGLQGLEFTQDTEFLIPQGNRAAALHCSETLPLYKPQSGYSQLSVFHRWLLVVPCPLAMWNSIAKNMHEILRSILLYFYTYFSLLNISKMSLIPSHFLLPQTLS